MSDTESSILPSNLFEILNSIKPEPISDEESLPDTENVEDYSQDISMKHEPRESVSKKRAHSINDDKYKNSTYTSCDDNRRPETNKRIPYEPIEQTETIQKSKIKRSLSISEYKNRIDHNNRSEYQNDHHTLYDNRIQTEHQLRSDSHNSNGHSSRDPRLMRHSISNRSDHSISNKNQNNNLVINPQFHIHNDIINNALNQKCEKIRERCKKAKDLLIEHNEKEKRLTYDIIFAFNDYANLCLDWPKLSSPLNNYADGPLLRFQAATIKEYRRVLQCQPYRKIPNNVVKFMKAIGSDIPKICETINDLSLSDPVDTNVAYSSDTTKEIGLQTDHIELTSNNFIPPDMDDKSIQCKMTTLVKDVEAQTDENTDGFSLNIETLKLLTPEQRKGLLEFKKLMNIKNDVKMMSIRTRQHHRKANEHYFAKEFEEGSSRSEHGNRNGPSTSRNRNYFVPG